MNQLKIRDIKAGDVVALPKLKKVDLDKITDFTVKIVKNYGAAQIISNVLAEDTESYMVIEVCKTKKARVEYAVLKPKKWSFHVFVPTRYLILTDRKPRHPITNIFMEDKFYYKGI